jgi:hypothetical protein
MKTLTTLLALAILSATACGQTIKALGYDTASGEVVANTGTNVLTFTNGEVTFTKLIVGDPAEGATVINDTAVDSSAWEYNGDPVISAEERVLYNSNGNLAAEFGDGLSLNVPLSFLNNFGQAATNAAITRTNLGIPLPALTNTSNVDMLSALGAAQTIFTVKTNDQTIIDETNATTITDLTFAIEPGARYVVTFLPIIEASIGNTGLQVVTSNATAFGNWNGIAASFATVTQITNEITLNVTFDRSPVSIFYVEGSTNAGSISVTFRSTVATNTNTIKAGSFLRADKMP